MIKSVKGCRSKGIVGEYKLKGVILNTGDTHSKDFEIMKEV